MSSTISGYSVEQLSFIVQITHVKQLSYIESFPSVIELIMNDCPDLERITDLPNLQKLTIENCPKLKVLEHIASLERLVLKDYTMEKLPEYMQDIKARHLQLFCRLWLLSAVASGQSGTEWDKFSQVEHVKAYARDGDNQRKWYVLYTRGDNYKLDSNISSSAIFDETLSSSMVDAQGFESMYKMRRSTFSYVCSLVRISFFEDMMARDHTFVDGRLLSLQDRVAVALRMLNSGDSPVTVGSTLGVNESTVLLVTKVFVEAMWKRAFHHISWPGSAQMEKMKCKLDKIHDLPNCCGIVQTAHITFGSQSGDHEENDSMLMQAVVDPDMRFTNIWLGPSGSMNQLSVLHDSWLFKSCQQGMLNGSKLNLSDGLEVGEYIIGDAGYPLLPWLLTPYRLEDKDLLSADFPPYQAEFNRRHSTALDITLSALGRWKDTRKILDRGVGSCPPLKTIYVCCILHNIVIDMQEEEEEEEEVCRLADLPPYQAEFNKRHATASTIMTAALARLKDNWRILDRGVCSCPPFATIYACCVLHNIVIDIAMLEEEEEEEEIAELEEEEEEEIAELEEEEEEEEIAELEEEEEEEEEEEIAELEEEEEEVPQVAHEDAVRVRDVLAKHLKKGQPGACSSRLRRVQEHLIEEEEILALVAAALGVAYSSGCRNKEQGETA